MSEMFTTNNKCLHCHGIVHNIDGKRHKMEVLESIHLVSCPGLNRKKAK